MESRGSRRKKTGVVLSNKAEKTIIVSVQERIRHSQYGKTVKRETKLAAHDEKNEAATGDLVEVMETRPLSKTKRWRLHRVVEKAQEPALEISEEIKEEIESS